MNSPQQRRPLSRRLGGVLAGAALSSLAVVTSVVVIGVDRDGSIGDSGVFIVIGAAMGVPVFLLGAVALVLLSGKTHNVRIINTTTALAVFVSLLPMGIIFLRQIWAAFAFSILFAVLVALVLSEPAERDLPERVPEPPSVDHPEPLGSAPVESPQPTRLEDATDAARIIPGRLPAPPQTQLSRTSRVAGRRRAAAQSGRRKRRSISFRARRRGYDEDGLSPKEPPQPAPATDATAPSPQDPGRDSPAILAALLERIESGLGRLERVLADRAAETEEKPSTANEGPAQRPVADAAETFPEERLPLLCGQVEASAGELDSLVDDADSRSKAWLAAPDSRGGAMSIDPEASEDASDALPSVREEMAILIKQLDARSPASRALAAYLAVIRNLRMRLAKYVEPSGSGNRR